MIDFLLGHYAYWFTVVLFLLGLYGMLMKQNLVKKVIGMNIFQAAVIMFYVASSSKWDATVPISDPDFSITDPNLYINPLPHTLMLTAIVVSVATTGVAFALLLTIYYRYKTLDEPSLLERMQ
jgi:multicomponent Na+:H+ antiporter subunit C